jgi:hypothetical protein
LPWKPDGLVAAATYLIEEEGLNDHNVVVRRDPEHHLSWILSSALFQTSGKHKLQACN